MSSFAVSCLISINNRSQCQSFFFLTRPGFQFSFLMNRDRQANVHRVVLDSNKIKIWTQAEHVGTHDSRRSYPWCVLKSGSHTGMTAVDSLFPPLITVYSRWHRRTFSSWRDRFFQLSIEVINKGRESVNTGFNLIWWPKTWLPENSNDALYMLNV